MKKKIIVILLVIGIFLPYYNSLGVTSYENNPDFNPNYLISDADLEDYTSMTVEQIRDFVKEKGGTLDTYFDPANGLPAYWLIWNAAIEYQISPKFLLALLQKEQSLVTDNTPSQSQYDWATGYSCYGGICLDAYRGFTNQIRAAAKKIKEYMHDLQVKSKHQLGFYCTFTKWCVGVSKQTQDQQIVTPQTKATAALYTYNPYQGNTVIDGYKVGANYNFWKIWTSWFETSNFRPNGTLLKPALSDDVYLIKDGQKRKFTSFTALISRYDPKNIITVSESVLDEYETGPEIKFPQYSLLIDPQGNIYMLVDDKLRHIKDMLVFRFLGFNPEELIEITNKDLESFDSGWEITLASSYPLGTLIQDATTNGVYYVRNGVKYPIVAPEILTINFPNQLILTGHTEELAQYPKGDPVRFIDGTLIKAKNDDKVYVISDGKKLHIKDEAAFVSRGYNWQNIIETSEEALNIHLSGSTLNALSTSTPDINLIEDQTSELEER